jgi:hypothetical protein
VVTGKWVFRHKHNADGSLACYKACWIIRGFAQCPRIDFGETFSPVVKPAMIKTMLTLVCSRGRHVHQLDVKNVFLHGVLGEQVYYYQPDGFVDDMRHNHVCRLTKSLYGLKQAPWAWFQCFSVAIDFAVSRSDAARFILWHGSDAAYLLAMSTTSSCQRPLWHSFPPSSANFSRSL